MKQNKISEKELARLVESGERGKGVDRLVEESAKAGLRAALDKAGVLHTEDDTAGVLAMRCIEHGIEL